MNARCTFVSGPRDGDVIVLENPAKYHHVRVPLGTGTIDGLYELRRWQCSCGQETLQLVWKGIDCGRYTRRSSTTCPYVLQAVDSALRTSSPPAPRYH
jgi:hypothetical protein